MFSNIVNEDLRSIKTKNTLYAAMYSLLKNHSFRKITVKGVCEKALISRAAFYAHFIDKYDLLERWLREMCPKDFNCDYTYDQIEKVVNNHIKEKAQLLKNLLNDADDETIDILFNFILSAVNLTIEKSSDGEAYPENIVFSNFFAGGIISYLQWQVKNKFPSGVPPMNRHLYKMIQELQAWKAR